MSADGNAEIYRAHIDRANQGDLHGYLDLYSDDVVFGGVTPEPMDKAGVVAFHEDFYTAFQGGQAEILDLVEHDDKLAVRLVIRGRHEQPFMGIPATPATTYSSPSRRSSPCGTASASSAGRPRTCWDC
jgi:predicted ester cyclase